MPRDLCSHCGKPNDRLPARYCRACQADYMRRWRAKDKRRRMAERTELARLRSQVGDQQNDTTVHRTTKRAGHR